MRTLKIENLKNKMMMRGIIKEFKTLKEDTKKQLNDFKKNKL